MEELSINLRLQKDVKIRDSLELIGNKAKFKYVKVSIWLLYILDMTKRRKSRKGRLGLGLILTNSNGILALFRPFPSAEKLEKAEIMLQSRLG